MDFMWMVYTPTPVRCYKESQEWNGVNLLLEKSPINNILKFTGRNLPRKPLAKSLWKHKKRT